MALRLREGGSTVAVDPGLGRVPCLFSPWCRLQAPGFQGASWRAAGVPSPALPCIPETSAQLGPSVGPALLLVPWGLRCDPWRAGYRAPLA